MAEQQIGRGLRRNYAIADHRQDVCDIFVPADSNLVELVRDLESMTRDEVEDDGETGEPRDGCEFRLESLPTWQLVDAEHDRSETLWVIDIDDPRVLEVAKEIAPSFNASGRPLDPNSIEDRARVAEAMSILMRKQESARSEDEMLKQLRSKVSKAVNVCASNYVKIRSRANGGSFERSLIADVSKRIHGYWKRLHAGHDEMVLDEIKAKYQWVESVDSGLKNGEIPSWLAI
jgi:hypothetical protein